MRIGNVEIKNNIALAPMAGVTDLPFRLLCKEQGCGLMCTEMVSAKAVLYNNKNTEDLMKTVPGERPLALQLFGSDPDIMADIAKRLSEREFDIIDVNMGCPVPKVVNNGEGSALMKDPVLVGRIVEKMADALDKPLTIITPSQPVCFIILTASSPLLISPLPITGIDTASLTCLIISQSACPE